MEDKKKESLTIEYVNGETKSYGDVVIKPTPINDKYFVFEWGPRIYYVNTNNVNAIVIMDKDPCGDSL